MKEILEFEKKKMFFSVTTKPFEDKLAGKFFWWSSKNAMIVDQRWTPMQEIYRSFQCENVEMTLFSEIIKLEPMLYLNIGHWITDG